MTKQKLVLPMTKERSLLCHFLAATFSSLVIAPPVVMLFDRRAPVIIEAVNITPNPVAPGGTLTVQWKVKEFRKCDGMVIRRFISEHDNIIRQTGLQQTVYHGNADGKSNEFETSFGIPMMPSGPAVYAPIVYRWCNVLQQHIWPMQTPVPIVPFTIAEKT